MHSIELPAETMEVTVNGEARNVPAQQCVGGLLEWLSLPTDRIAVELNKVIVRKRDWPTTPVPAGAQLEIVEFVGGG